MSRELKLLGRQPYGAAAPDRIRTNLEHLDALLAVVSDREFDGDEGNNFQRFNRDIQRSILGLAADLAWETHDLYVRLHGEG